MDHTQRVARWLEPVPGPLPAGPDARYDPAYEAVRSKVVALDTPAAPAVDWSEIVRTCEALLVEKSKDVLLACHAAFGLYHTEGLPGLAAGLWLVAEITDRYWDAGWPPVKRVRARVNAIDWLTERLAMSLPNVQVGPADREAVTALRAAADRLAEVAGARFEDPAPKMRPLLDAVKRLELSLPAEPAPAPAPAAPAPAPAAVAVAPAPVASAAPAAGPSREEELAALVKPFLAPISDAAPAGKDAKYEPEHEAVRAAVAQLDTPTGKAVDWAEVERACTTVLKAKSKDVLIASYLAFAMIEQRGFEGAALGLGVLAGVLDAFWETAFPPPARLRARANAVAWLVDRFEMIAGRKVEARDREAVLLLEVAARRLCDVVYARFEDQAPGVRPLLDAAKRLVLSLPAEEAPKPAPPAPAAPPPPAPTAAPAPAAPTAAPAPAAPAPAPPAAPKGPAVAAPMPEAPGELGDVSQIDPFLRKVGAALHKASRSIFKAAPANPASYRLARVGLLLHMDAPPPVTSGRQTGVPPPPPTTVAQLETLLRNKAWAALLDEAEGALGTQRFWLDLHRYVALALAGLGHGAARAAVVAATGEILRRMPEVRTLQFNTGEPFASPATQQWFDEEVTPVARGGGGDGLRDEERERFDEARALAADGQVAEALELLGAVAAGARSGAVEFRARLAMARACAAAGALAAADGVFASLHAEIDAYKLEWWDPELAAGCYAAHFEVLKALTKKGAGDGKVGDPSIAARASEVYARLCRVSPPIALKLGA